MTTLRTGLACLVVVLAACGPSKAERERMQRSLDEQEAKNQAAEKERKSIEPRLKALAEAVRAACKAEFKRLSDENLGAGTEDVADCGLAKEPDWRIDISSTRGTPAELGSAMERPCDELQKELDLAVLRAGPDNPSSSRDSDAAFALEKFEETVLVGLVHDQRVFPELVKDASGAPKSFKPGLFEGTAYVFPLVAAKVTCASRVAAKNSEKVEYFKAEALGAEGTAALDLDDNLEREISIALEKAPRVALSPVPKAAPAKAAKKSKAPAKKKKTR